MIRRSKIKARPVIKRSQPNAKSDPQNSNPTDSSPKDDQQKVIKVGDDIPVLSTSSPAITSQLDVTKTTVTNDTISTGDSVCDPQHDGLIPSHEVLADHQSVSEFQHAKILTEPRIVDSYDVMKETTSEKDFQLNDNLPSGGEANMLKSPSCAAGPHRTETTITTIDDKPVPEQMIADNNKVIDSQKSALPGGRRRKIMACPMAGKKRRKVDTKAKRTEPNTNADACAPSDNHLVAASTNPITTMTTCLQKNVETADGVIVNLETCRPTLPVESPEDVVLTNVAALTVINEATPEAQMEDSPIFGIKPSNDGTAFDDIPTASTDQPACHSTAEASVSLTPNESLPVELPKSNSVQQLQFESLPKIPHPKKCIVKVKTKSLSNKYRSKAMEKLNCLKQKQSNNGSEWPELDQNYVSMSDLIFLNPPAKVGHKLGMNAEQEQTVVESVLEPSAASTDTTETVEDSNNDKPLPVPQIRIAEDGSVVVDEESLVLDTQKPQDPAVRTVYESGKDTAINQRSFMRRSFAKGIRWSVEETNEFYRCLCIVGAEFSLMSAMFRGRSPDDLRRKFRREHKNNPVRVDQALMQQHLSKWTDDMFKAKEPNSSSILKPLHETPMQS